MMKLNDFINDFLISYVSFLYNYNFILKIL